MVTEHVLLPIIPGREEEFEVAFAAAKSIIVARPGFEGLTLSRGIEHPNTYLMLVQWTTLEDHDPGFRGSPEYQDWRAALHHFYDPFPVFKHFEVVATA